MKMRPETGRSGIWVGKGRFRTPGRFRTRVITEGVIGGRPGGIANLFMHYAFDTWMSRNFPAIWFERFSDDVVAHYVSERQARFAREAIGRRLANVGLELHPGKTRLVYGKDSRRRGSYETVSFTFCGYTFRPRKAYSTARKTASTSFLPAVAPGKLTAMSRRVTSWQLGGAPASPSTTSQPG